jgi:hypothetical protein
MRASSQVVQDGKGPSGSQPPVIQERINKLFKGETPKVSDSEIKGLITKYPPPPNIQRLIFKLTENN